MNDVTRDRIDPHDQAEHESEALSPDSGSLGAAAPDAEAPGAGAPESGALDSDAASSDQLEREGDAAADYIEELLDICDLDGDIDIDSHNGRPYLAVTSEDLDDLRLLSKPETVGALQELTRLAVQQKTGSFSRLILDIGGSRDARQAELAQLVDRAIERLGAGATTAALPPMTSYERKLVHDITSDRGFVSESEGEGGDRHTVIRRG